MFIFSIRKIKARSQIKRSIIAFNRSIKVSIYLYISLIQEIMTCVNMYLCRTAYDLSKKKPSRHVIDRFHDCLPTTRDTAVQRKYLGALPHA